MINRARLLRLIRWGMTNSRGCSHRPAARAHVIEDNHGVATLVIAPDTPQLLENIPKDGFGTRSLDACIAVAERKSSTV